MILKHFLYQGDACDQTCFEFHFSDDTNMWERSDTSPDTMEII